MTFREKYKAGAMACPSLKAQAHFTTEGDAASAAVRSGRPASRYRIRHRERRQHGGQVIRRNARQIALQVDDDVVGAGGIEALQRGMNTVGAGGQRRVGEDGSAAGGGNGFGNLGLGAGHRNRPQSRVPGPVQHMDDHRQAADIGQRLAGQTGGSQAGGDQDDGGHGNVLWVRLRRCKSGDGSCRGRPIRYTGRGDGSFERYNERDG